MERTAQQPLRRVAVMGMPGAGKSTLAVHLGEALDAPVFHLDAIYWKTDEPAQWEDFHAEERKLVALDRWVLDGNYSHSGGLEERLARADAVVIMEVGRCTAVRRVVWRALRDRGPSPHGNPKGASWEFIGWVWNWKRDQPDLVESLRPKVDHKPLIVVRTRREAAELLDEAHHRSRLVEPPPRR